MSDVCIKSEVGSRKSELSRATLRCGNYFRPPISDFRLRSGISLLEVLIAIFILGVGLLGIGALLPVGQTQIAEGNVQERAATLAQYAARQIKIGAPLNCRFDTTGLLDSGRIGSMVRPENWFAWVNTGTAHWDDWATVVSTAPASLQPSASTFLPALTAATAASAPLCVAIDPLMIARNAPNPGTGAAGGDFSVGVDRFPYSNAAATTPTPMTNPALWMKRVTLFNIPSGAGNNQLIRAGGEALAEQVFLGHDDLSFDSTTFKDRKPLWPNGFFRQSNTVFGPAQGVVQKRPYEGMFSWMATLIPATGADGVILQNQFTLSIIVFYQRTCLYDPFSERQVNVPQILNQTTPINPLNSGFGGVRVELNDDLNHVLSSTTAANATPLIKPGDWMMLGGIAPCLDGSGAAANRQVFKWYKIVGVGQKQQTNGTKMVTTLTLQGPDWNPVWSSTTATALPAVGAATATFVNGVVAVYERTIRIDNASLYTQ